MIHTLFQFFVKQIKKISCGKEYSTNKFTTQSQIKRYFSQPKSSHTPMERDMIFLLLGKSTKHGVN